MTVVNDGKDEIAIACFKEYSICLERLRKTMNPPLNGAINIFIGTIVI
jgi:hypothetical protein